ncbi:unnamed protein product [Cyclocybe aegerita]|uniref:Uncharacterized protein n=1 Tax=Cyclocybe aegerita TaxID=1973307 RepID=A0A8S0WBJ4_CYCAE|nr:unnamed protein product [Cyclocybe aegerita]
MNHCRQGHLRRFTSTGFIAAPYTSMHYFRSLAWLISVPRKSITRRIEQRRLKSTRTQTVKRVTKTLIPERMTPANQECCDFSNKARPYVYFGANASAHRPIALGYVSERPNNKSFRAVPFPEGTFGVLYYYHDRTHPAVSGNLRLRICDSPGSFGRGKDLEQGIGEPWSVPLFSLIRSPCYTPIRRLLRMEGLVDNGLVSYLEQLPLLIG